jgi:dipeptidyl-peptidase-4
MVATSVGRDRLRRGLWWAGVLGCTLFGLMTWPACAMCQEEPPSRVTRANYELAGRFTANGMRSMVADATVRPVWIDQGRRFWYPLRVGTVIKFFMVDVEDKSKSEIVVDLNAVGPNLVEFSIEGRDYHLDTVSGEVTQLDPQRGLYRDFETPSPDRKHAAYSKDHNLVVRSLDSGSGEIQVTRDGERYYSFAEPSDYFFTDEHLRTDDSARAAEVFWAPDSKKLVATRLDVRHLRDFWVTNSLATPIPALTTFKQRFPGDRPPAQEVWIYSLAGDSLLQIRADKWSPSIYEDIVWSRDSRHLYMVRKSPDQLEADLLEVDAATGRFRVLLTESFGGLVLTEPVVELGEGEGFLWWSRKDGYGHYYHYDPDGNPGEQVTSGAFNVADLVGIDRSEGVLYLSANGRERRRNPYYEHFYSVKLSSGELRLLTHEDAHHQVYLAPGNAHFVDNYSRVDQAHKAVLRAIDGAFLMEVEATDISRLVDAGWRAPEVIRVKAADGRTDLWGVIWKPYDFDPDRRYPIISFVYPGPQDELVPLTFLEALCNNAHLAQYGFIVVHAGNRGGSYKRSLEYSEYYRGNLRDYPLADNKAVIEALAAQHDWIDGERVGIWGGSSGAYAALAGMLTYPDFYRVCVARSGPHDPAIYHAWWSDQFQGMTRSRSASGAVEWLTDVAEGNLELARNLKGHLLLIHSEMDTNVHPAHSARMARALMGANKRFDYLVVPGAGHGWGQNWAYVQRVIWTYFVCHLMGDTRWDVDVFEDFQD